MAKPVLSQESPQSPSQHSAEKIPVGISACLTGEEVRYNGGHKLSRYCMNVLADAFEFVPSCPEMAIGLGVPRPTIRLVGDVANPRVQGSEDASLDVTDQMTAYSEQRASELDHLSGYIFIKDSPSCGVFRVKVYQPNGHPAEERRAGIFADTLMKKYPQLPVEEEGRLNDPPLRENFVLRVFAHRDWQLNVRGANTAGRLVDFHSRYKYVLMAHSQQYYQTLGRLVARVGTGDFAALKQRYFADFMQALAKPATRKNHTNVLLHILGYLKHDVPGSARQEVVNVINQYHQGFVQLAVPVTLLNHYVRQYGNDYIRQQAYLNPYPLALGLRNAI